MIKLWLQEFAGIWWLRLQCIWYCSLIGKPELMSPIILAEAKLLEARGVDLRKYGLEYRND